MRNYEINPKWALKDIREQFKDYMANSNLESVVLGVSGGVDSALIAAIVEPVCKELKIKLIGFSLPSESNKEEEVERAAKVCRAYCDDFIFQPIDDYVKTFTDGNMSLTNPETKEDKIRRGNIKARVRMIKLYDCAQACKGLVLGTDNLTEYNLGFWTLHGDVGDLGLIQNLWKSDVYKLSQYIVDKELNGGVMKDNIKGNDKSKSLQLCIDAVPTDGLGITSSDLEQIDAKTYEEADDILALWLGKKVGVGEYDIIEKYGIHPVVQRYEKTHFKRGNPLNIELRTMPDKNSIVFKLK